MWICLETLHMRLCRSTSAFSSIRNTCFLLNYHGHWHYWFPTVHKSPENQVLCKLNAELTQCLEDFFFTFFFKILNFSGNPIRGHLLCTVIIRAFHPHRMACTQGFPFWIFYWSAWWSTSQNLIARASIALSYDLSRFKLSHRVSRHTWWVKFNNIMKKWYEWITDKAHFKVVFFVIKPCSEKSEIDS